MARPLSAKEIKARMAAHRSGMSVADMAKKFGTSQNAIYNFLQRRNVRGGEATCPTCGQNIDVGRGTLRRKPVQNEQPTVPSDVEQRPAVATSSTF